MDEPTNHLDIESIIWLESFLKQHDGALLMTSHDREFMNRIVSKIAEIDSGEITVYSGNYDFYDRERTIREANKEAAYARQQAMLAKEQRFIDRFKKNAAKAAQVQSRIKALDKIEKLELPKQRVVVKFTFRDPPRSGDQVAVIEGLHKAYGKRVIYDGFNFTIRRGERWAVMGRNGAGKTTLLRIVAGALKPDAGDVRIGASVPFVGPTGKRPTRASRRCSPRSSASSSVSRPTPPKPRRCKAASRPSTRSRRSSRPSSAWW